MTLQPVAAKRRAKRRAAECKTPKKCGEDAFSFSLALFTKNVSQEGLSEKLANALNRKGLENYINGIA